MKKTIWLLIFLMVFTCNNLLAATTGGVPKPFCKITEAAVKADDFFKGWLLNVGRKDYKDYFIQEISYTNYYESDRGNLLKDQWTWVIKFQNSKISTYSHTLALKENGKIEIISATK